MVGNPTDNNEDKTNAGDEALTEKFDRAHENKQNKDEWYITISTIPVKNEALIEGFAEQVGMPSQSMLTLFRALEYFAGDSIDFNSIFDKIGIALYGAEPNHTFFEVKNSKGETVETFEAMGLEFKDGKPVLSGKGELVPVIRNDATNPLYEARRSIEHTETIVNGSKDEVYQAYSTMLTSANQIFDVDKKIDYDFLKKNCNTIVGALQSNNGGQLDARIAELGIGMKDAKNQFKVAADPTTLTGEALMNKVAEQKQRLGYIIDNRIGLSQDNTVELEGQHATQ